MFHQKSWPVENNEKHIINILCMASVFKVRFDGMQDKVRDLQSLIVRDPLRGQTER